MKNILVFLIAVIMLFMAGCVSMAHATEPTPVTVTSPVTINPPPIPESPGSISISGITDIGATVSWSPVATASQYSVWVNGTRWTGTDSPGVTIHGLQAYAIYDICVTAANESGESAKSSTASFTTLPPVPAAPSAPTIANVKDNTALVQWEPLPPSQYILAYRVYVDGVPVADVIPQEGIQAANLTNLQEGNHKVSIAGINANREGPLSNPIQFNISVISAPTGLQMINHSVDNIWLRWDPVAGADKYIITVNEQITGETKQASYTVESLNSEKSFNVEVVAVMPDGNLSQPATIQVNTLPAHYPLTKETLVQRIFSYSPDVLPGLVMIFVVGGSFALARTAKENFTQRIWFIRR